MMVDSSSSNTTSGSDRTFRAKAAELNHVQRVRQQQQQQLNTATDSSSSKETTMAMMW
jgi:hypothetical protein